MVRDVKPKILVLIDEVDENFQKEIELMGAIVCIFQVYKNKDGSHAFRLHGEYPKLFEKSSHCKFLTNIPNTLEIFDSKWLIDGLEKINNQSNKFVQNYRRKNKKRIIKPITNTKDANEIDIDLNGKISRWKVIRDSNKVYLKAIGVNSISVVSTYSLSADHNFKLYLKHN